MEPIDPGTIDKNTLHLLCDVLAEMEDMAWSAREICRSYDKAKKYMRMLLDRDGVPTGLRELVAGPLARLLDSAADGWPVRIAESGMNPLEEDVSGGLYRGARRLVCDALDVPMRGRIRKSLLQSWRAAREERENGKG